MEYHPATDSDIPALAALRAREWGAEVYWINRITDYRNGQANPQLAHADRTLIVAWDKRKLAGFIAGHRTRRHGCDGELQWINVAEAYRGKGVASELLKRLAAWFVARDATRVCVNVEPAQERAYHFYRKHHAVPLDPYWLLWPDISVVGQVGLV